MVNGRQTLRETLPLYDVVFDVAAFDGMIQSQGVTLIHYAAMRCPIGLIDRGDIRAPNHKDHDCSNGFLYKKAGALEAIFTGNTLASKIQDIGVVDGSTVQITLSRTYEDGSPTAIAPFDRFYLQENVATVVNWQTIEAHVTGRDKLQFPATQIEFLVDSNGKEYFQDQDFTILNGFIVWKNGVPNFDPSTNKGIIYSVRYRYIPFWYCDRLLHEIRVTRQDNISTGEKGLSRMPYGAILKRETVFENEQNPELLTNGDIRDVPGSRVASFGPR
jgi:hypothetical protein